VPVTTIFLVGTFIGLRPLGARFARLSLAGAAWLTLAPTAPRANLQVTIPT
jgi:hypothetical protein